MTDGNEAMKSLITALGVALLAGWAVQSANAQGPYRIDRFGHRVHICKPPWAYTPRTNWTYTPRKNWHYKPRDMTHKAKKDWTYTPKTDWTYTPKVYYRDRCWAAYRARTHVQQPRRGPQIIYFQQE